MTDPIISQSDEVRHNKPKTIRRVGICRLSCIKTVQRVSYNTEILDMIEVLISWIFIGITSYVTGFELLRLLWKLLNRAGSGIGSGADTDVESAVGADGPDRIISHPNILRCLLGLCAVNVYAEMISLFTGVGMWADYILMLICLIIVFADRERIGKAMDLSGSVRKHPVRSCLYAILLLVMSYGTSRGYMHFDTNLYHAQAIHWIEDYGLVPGLANLQSRFGYNSAEFALNALYGFKWYLGRSLHTSAGFFALLSSFVILGMFDGFGERSSDTDPSDRAGRLSALMRDIRMSDYARIGLIFYLGMIFTEMISPASDYYATLLVFDIVIIWLDISIEKNNRIMSTATPSIVSPPVANTVAVIQSVLCILLVYAITIKLSLAPLVLLALIPGIYWLRNKNVKAIITCLVSGLIISIPYFIRGYYISGWILYPSTLIKIGSPDWQIPKGMAQYDAREIGMWGRGITRAEDWAGVTATNWLRGWFAGLHMMERCLVIVTFISVLIAAFACIKELLQIIKSRSAAKMSSTSRSESDPADTGRLGISVILFILSVGTVFWFCSAPLIRYGYAYLCILPFATLGYLMTETKLHDIQASKYVFPVVYTGVLCLRLFNLTGDIYNFRTSPYYVNQQDYIDGDAFTYEVDGVTIYVATDSGQIGYYKIPSTVEERYDFELRGADLSDGFRHINN